MPDLKRCAIAYVPADDTAQDAHRLLLEAVGKGRYLCRDPYAAVNATFDGEVMDICLQAYRDIRVDACELEVEHHFLSSERLLLNGYQSWTDTHETGIDAFRHGLRGMPRRIIDRFLLDAAGDYRFVDYGFVRGRLHGWTYATMRRGDSVFLLGSLNEDDGFTLIRFSTYDHRIYIEKETPQRIIHAGETVHLCKIAAIKRSAADFPFQEKTLIGIPAAEAAAFDRWFELMGVTRLAAKPLVGYSSWYRLFDSVNAEDIKADLKAAATVMANVDTHGFERLFQIDDGYAKVGDWLETYPEKFPHGLKPLVRFIKQEGFTPGLWVAPFVCEVDCRTYLEHPDWLLRDTHGAPVHTGLQWNGGLALDTLNPEVRQFITGVLRTMTQDWGFELLKIDFLYVACMEPHGGMNRGQLMADALQLIRDAVGPDVQLLGCGVPLGSAFGRVEYCRVGCDVGLDWNNHFYYSILSRERISTKRSLGNTVGRAPLNGRAFLNDPDVFFLRDDVSIEREQEDLLLEGDACFGGALLTSDNMSVWRKEDVERFQRAVDYMRAALSRFDGRPTAAPQVRSGAAAGGPAAAGPAAPLGGAQGSAQDCVEGGESR